MWYTITSASQLHKEQMSTESLFYKVFLIVMNCGSDLVVELMGKYFLDMLSHEHMCVTVT